MTDREREARIRATEAIAARLLASYRERTGRELLEDDGAVGPGRLLFDAPIAVLSHGTEDDPVLQYGNRLALELWEADWNAFTSMPSRLTAEPGLREVRRKLLDDVRANGYSDGFEGIRVSLGGRRFRIANATVWNVTDEQGRYAGQAAAIREWSML